MNHSRSTPTRPPRRVAALVGLVAALCAAAQGAAPGTAFAAAADGHLRDSLATAGAGRGTAGGNMLATILDSLRGRSGKLRARFVVPERDVAFAVFTRDDGDSGERGSGVYTVGDSIAGARPFSLITLLPFTSKSGARVESYRVGYWPGERRAVRSPAYENPMGFIRVTRENQDTRISDHFRLRDFLTHDQPDVWPKYLVLREALVDKLELVIDDLRAHHVRVDRLAVMSGFRTPQYNQEGVGRGGRARDSRHQFGDAADVFVDNDDDGRMDDLNHDGRVNTRDAQVVIDAVDRVERAHPDLVGGAGRYRATRAHGPFVHVDVRGARVRWKNG